jgi:hypothetical protein
MLLVGRRRVGIAGRDHHALDAEAHGLVEEGPHALGVGAVEEGRVGRDAKSPCHRRLDRAHGLVEGARPADRRVVLGLEPVEVHAEGEVAARREQAELLLEQERVRAQVDVPAPLDEARDQAVDLRVQEGLAARDAHDRGAALVGGAQAGLDRELRAQHVRRVLDLPAAGAGEVAAVEGLEHQHEREARLAAQPPAQQIGRHRPHLRERDAHG